MGNVLVIAPHADDEAFGMGGTIRKMRTNKWHVQVVVMSVGKQEDNDDTVNERLGEMKRANQELGWTNPKILSKGYDARMDELPLRSWIEILENQLKEVPYQYVFYPYPSHHQDHIVTQQACIAALRPGALSYTPRGIYMYEYTYPGWKTMDIPQGRMYVDITDEFRYKIKAIAEYGSQFHAWPHPVSVHAAMTLASMRGMAIEAQYAEMFYVVQEVMQI